MPGTKEDMSLEVLMSAVTIAKSSPHIRLKRLRERLCEHGYEMDDVDAGIQLWKDCCEKRGPENIL